MCPGSRPMTQLHPRPSCSPEGSSAGGGARERRTAHLLQAGGPAPCTRLRVQSVTCTIILQQQDSIPQCVPTVPAARSPQLTASSFLHQERAAAACRDVRTVRRTQRVLGSAVGHADQDFAQHCSIYRDASSLAGKPRRLEASHARSRMLPAACSSYTRPQPSEACLRPQQSAAALTACEKNIAVRRQALPGELLLEAQLLCAPEPEGAANESASGNGGAGREGTDAASSVGSAAGRSRLPPSRDVRGSLPGGGKSGVYAASELQPVSHETVVLERPGA